MRIIKHALLSLLRKPTKAVMIFSILILVFGLVFTGIIIQNSVRESKDFVRIQLGATVSYAPDYMKAMNDELDSEGYEQMILSETVANEIAKDSRVKKLHLIKNAYAVGKNVKSGRNFGGEGDEDIIVFEDEGGFEMETYINIIGTNANTPIEFENGSLTLTEGDFFTDEQQQNSESVAIITAELASKNNYSIGDSFLMTNYADGSDVEFKIVGIYDGASTYNTDNIFTPLDATNQFFYSEEENYYTSVYFLLDDPLEVNDFISDHKSKLPSEYTTLTANEDEFKKLTRPLDLMEIITSILIWVVFGAGALIVLAIVTIFVRDRKFEIGLLLASGESKLKIVSQFILEIMIIASIAFIVATGVSQLSSGFVGDWIVENQLVTEEDSSNDFDEMIFMGMGETKGNVDMTNIADEFNVGIELSVILNLLLISFGILLFAASIPLIIIMSYKPREALQD